MQPKTFLVGHTEPDLNGLADYLQETGQYEYYQDFLDAYELVGPVSLCSFYAKLCYRSLVLGKNANVERVRDAESNLKGVFDSGHGSVFEHVQLNFVTTNCSRVLTHEMVRHRVGTAYSQTSGRYVALDDIDLVYPPEYDSVFVNGVPLKVLIEEHCKQTSQLASDLRKALISEHSSFADKKRVTSFIRRIAPNGQTNEIGWSCNIRSVRHMIEMRTSRHAEWEIRKVFHDVAQILRRRWPLMLYGGKAELVDGFDEWTSLKV